jgi:hypothetical protein
MHTAKSLKAKNHIVFFIQQTKLKKKYYFSMHFGFNNQFIKVMRTWPIFQKNQKIFCFVLMSGITNLYVKRILDIKKVFLL